MFPPVRPRGHLEVRYVDAQPGHDWVLPTAVLVALLAMPHITDRVLEICEPAQGRWVPAARDGLADLVLARTAIAVLERTGEIGRRQAGVSAGQDGEPPSAVGAVSSSTPRPKVPTSISFAWRRLTELAGWGTSNSAHAAPRPDPGRMRQVVLSSA
jgi:hypothetical protein